jgi:hypothetical protein
VKDWAASFDFTRINILSNHSELSLDHLSGINLPEVRIIHNKIRPDWMLGSLPECWNACYLWAFSEGKEWVICSQDDNFIKPGWDQCIQESNYDSYWAPAGDCIHVMSFTEFKRIGWWDERFRIPGGGEQDYQLRQLRESPSTVSIYDDHPWRLRHNIVGLQDYWGMQGRTGEIMEVRDEHSKLWWKECYDRWNEKWGVWINDLFESRNWHGVQPAWPEIDWYPSFTRKMRMEKKMEGPYEL